MSAGVDAGTTITLRLLGLPTELYVRNRRLLDDLTHELKMVRSGQMSGMEVEPELADSLDAILAAYAGPRDVLFNAARDGLVAGRESVDVEVDVPAASVGPVRRILQLLQQAEDLSRRGILLTLPAPPEVWQLREWVMRELERQVAGEEPAPFRDGALG